MFLAVAQSVASRGQINSIGDDYIRSHLYDDWYYSANPWGRRIKALGHTVKCIPAHVVKPFVRGNKNDANDALAIAEAALRPNVRFVEIKSVEQQDIQSLERIRERLLKNRSGDSNQLRGLLAEYGIILPVKQGAIKKYVPDISEDAENELSITARHFIQGIYPYHLKLRVSAGI